MKIRPRTTSGLTSLIKGQRSTYIVPGVSKMGVVMMVKLAGYYLYSYTDLVKFERFSVLEITFLVDVYRNLS